MPLVRVFAVIGAVLVVVPYAAGGDRDAGAKGEAAPAGGTAEEAAVLKCVDRVAALFSSKSRTSLDDVRSLLGRGLTRIDSFGLMTESKEASVAQYRKDLALLKQRFVEYHETWEPQSVRLFDDVAIVLGRFEMTGVLRNSDRRVRVPFWGTYVLRKDGGLWQFVHIAFVRAAQPRPPGSHGSTERAEDPPNARVEHD